MLLKTQTCYWLSEVTYNRKFYVDPDMLFAPNNDDLDGDFLKKFKHNGWDYAGPKAWLYKKA